MKQFIIEACQRFRSAVPPFFRKVQALGASLAAFGSALQALNLPTRLLTVAGYLAVAGGVMVAVAQLTQKNVWPKSQQAPVQDAPLAS